MDISVLTHFVTTMLAISLAAERMIEILKGWFPNFYLFKTNGNDTKESRRIGTINLLSGICGYAIARVGDLDVYAMIGGHSKWAEAGYILAGVLASFGSALWNHLLDLMKAFKVQKEQAAIQSVAATQKQNILSDVHPSSFSLAMSSPLELSTTGTSTAAAPTFKRTVNTPKPGRAVVNTKAGEFLKFVVTDGGPAPVFAMSGSNGTIFSPSSGSPQNEYEWYRFRDTGDPLGTDVLVITFIFLANTKYGYTCELWDPTGLKKTVFDIEYEGAPTDYYTEFQTVEAI